MRYDLYYGIWSICTDSMIMIDFDIEDGFDRLDAVQALEDFVKSESNRGVDRIFWIYETDRGLHAFLPK